MSVLVEEKWDSRETTLGDSSSVDLLFIVSGTDSDVVAHAELIAKSPAFYGGLPRQSTHIERLTWDIWEGSVRYGSKEPTETGDSTYSFETGGGTQHITQSIATVGSYAASGSAPNFFGAIGVTHDSVEGVDITIPLFNFSETHYLPASAVTDQYKGTLFSLTGTVNNGGFRNFDQGEVLFLGASGSKRGAEDWEIGFRFAGSPNATGLTVGSISGINKRGFEYMWVRYADAVDEDAHQIVKKPIAVYVEQVYPYGNFSQLGIG